VLKQEERLLRCIQEVIQLLKFDEDFLKMEHLSAIELCIVCSRNIGKIKRTVLDLPRRKRERIITEQMKALMEDELNKNDELTSTGIKTLLSQKWPGLQVSLSIIKRVRKNMGWVCTRPHYCQLIREVSYDF